jgi:hypothetical protein
MKSWKAPSWIKIVEFGGDKIHAKLVINDHKLEVEFKSVSDVTKETKVTRSTSLTLYLNALSVANKGIIDEEVQFIEVGKWVTITLEQDQYKIVQ